MSQDLEIPDLNTEVKNIEDLKIHPDYILVKRHYRLDSDGNPISKAGLKLPASAIEKVKPDQIVMAGSNCAHMLNDFVVIKFNNTSSVGFVHDGTQYIIVRADNIILTNPPHNLAE